MRHTKLYVDLDGVLVDFDRGYADVNAGVAPSGGDDAVGRCAHIRQELEEEYKVLSMSVEEIKKREV